MKTKTRCNKHKNRNQTRRTPKLKNKQYSQGGDRQLVALTPLNNFETFWKNHRDEFQHSRTV